MMGKCTVIINKMQNNEITTTAVANNTKQKREIIIPQFLSIFGDKNHKKTFFSQLCNLFYFFVIYYNKKNTFAFSTLQRLITMCHIRKNTLNKDFSLLPKGKNCVSKCHQTAEFCHLLVKKKGGFAYFFCKLCPKRNFSWV